MFIPHTKEDREAMLRTIGIDDLSDLFLDVPAQHRFPDLDLPHALTEMEVSAEMQTLASANETVDELISFLGAGAYNHYVPSALDSLLRRGEFYTAYTPYQPEVSQGTLQAIFDYQSLIVALTGMDVCNASHYDGGTAVAEAASLAFAQFRGKRNQVVLSPALHPQYREVVRTYHYGSDIEVVEADRELDPASEPDALKEYLNEKTALVVVQYPDFLGRIFDYSELADAVHDAGGLLAVSVNPLSLGLLKPPGDFGADIVTGEGQTLGIPLSYGGPYLGIFATRLDYVRKMAGRLVGETVDNRENERAYVLTLTAREQHIRRERATSNICTNQGLMALAATIYLSLVGKSGLRQVAELCYHKAHFAADEIAGLPGFEVWSSAPFFNEFVVETPIPAEEINEHLLSHGILGGYVLKQDYPELDHHLLVAVTEMNTREDIDILVETLAEVSHD